ncbi:MAG: hypothetical protein FWE28_01930 [Oscillospiraceae bacterium]|nr:hypothetical protein [Oscillospiraceae bacterium]
MAIVFVGDVPRASQSLTFSFGGAADFGLAGTASVYVLPDGPSLRFRKEAKETQGLRPYVPARSRAEWRRFCTLYSVLVLKPSRQM